MDKIIWKFFLDVFFFVTKFDFRKSVEDRNSPQAVGSVRFICLFILVFFNCLSGISLDFYDARCVSRELERLHILYPVS